MALLTKKPVATRPIKELKASCEVFKGCKELEKKGIEFCFFSDNICLTNNSIFLRLNPTEGNNYLNFIKEDSLTVMLLQPNYKTYNGIYYDLAWVYAKDTGIGMGLVLCHWNDGTLS